eukprot:231191-Chlamydomonas_euryale.AAC.1
MLFIHKYFRPITSAALQSSVYLTQDSKFNLPTCNPKTPLLQGGAAQTPAAQTTMQNHIQALLTITRSNRQMDGTCAYLQSVRVGGSS